VRAFTSTFCRVPETLSAVSPPGDLIISPQSFLLKAMSNRNLGWQVTAKLQTAAKQAEGRKQQLLECVHQDATRQAEWEAATSHLQQKCAKLASTLDVERCKTR